MSKYQLEKKGITQLKTTDKLHLLKFKYLEHNLNNIPKTLIANRIFVELFLSAWNVSSNFLSCMDNAGRMYLEGFGDPTNGHGGISFIKYPLKTSRLDSLFNRIS